MGVSYLIMKITERDIVGRTLMVIGYKYYSSKVPRCIATEGSGSTEKVDPYLSCYPEIVSNVSVRPDVCIHLIGRYFNAYNTIDNHNRIRNYDPALEKYWVGQSGHSRLAAAVELGICIIDGKIIFCHGISDVSLDNKVSTIEDNNITVYNYFNNPFRNDCGSPAFNIPPITIDDRLYSQKVSCYTPDLIPSTIAVATGNFVHALSTLYDYPRLFILPSDYINHFHSMNNDEPYRGRSKRG